MSTRLNKPVVAFMYDFDGTLSPGNMQEYGFLDKLGESSTEFWRKSNEEARKFEMDPISAYMHLMIKETESRALNISKENLIKLGQTVELFPGVETWFKRINEYAHTKGLKVEHFIISSGLKEIIEGTPIAKEFRKIFASAFIFDAYGKPIWPAQIVNFTTKTQYIFRINKDSLDLADVKKVNQYIPQDERRVPFRRMVYFGDGDTDVPCMKLFKAEGGFSIAVYPARKKEKAGQLLADNRCSYIAPTDYSPDTKVEKLAFGIIDLIAAQENLNKLAEK